MKKLLLIMLILFSYKAYSAPAKILIIAFENATGDNKNDALTSAIPELLSVCFANNPSQVVIVDRSALQASLSEQALSWEQYVAKNSIQAVGQAIKANYILRGSLTLKQQQPQVQALLFDVATTALQTTVSGAINLDNIVGSLCTAVASPLVTALPKATAHTAIPVTDQLALEKQQLLIDGLNHYFNGEYARSFIPLLKLVKAYPDDADAHFWLAQSFYRAGLSGFAYIQFQDFINRFDNNARVVKVKTLLKELKSNKE